MIARDTPSRYEGYGLTTAGILYRLPDHPSILQEFVWQDYDHAPLFPRLNVFLRFWQEKLEGALFRVTVGHRDLVTPAELRVVDGLFRLN